MRQTLFPDHQITHTQILKSRLGIETPHPFRPRSTGLSTRVTPSTVEKHLPNGDVYYGTFSGNTPHGSGKYVWSDGCMYEGEWKKGKASGKGRFSWPSGATYEGDFKSGHMDGFGSFTGSDGDTYRGSWVSDQKNGYGQKRYANGDLYEGWWRRNLQEGQGRYVWMNQNGQDDNRAKNEYVGEWQNGVISGKGVLIWENGNRYDGVWEQGVPKGNGVLRWPDGSSYMGFWNKDAGESVNCLKGPFLRSGRSSKSSNSTAVDKIFPRICIWESDGEDITCDIVDNIEASMFYCDGTGMDCDGFRQFRKKKKNPMTFNSLPGETISKGHKKYELMLNLQMGIRHSVGKHASILRDLKTSDFDPKQRFWTRFPPEGSKTTPRHQSAEFRWKDYCPVVFRHLRELFRVDPADYMLAICGDGALRELSSPGKSGCFFYLTQDDRLMIKTVRKSEVKVLVRMLQSYYRHVSNYENSLVTKFFGVHCVKPVSGQKTRFIVMGNLFCSEYQIHRRFDLKGSSHGRSTNMPESEIDETTTLKDLDLNYIFRLQPNRFQELISQIDLDCRFLEGERIMDYSLLIGLHFRDENVCDKIGLSPFVPRSGKHDTYQNEKFMRGCRFLEAELQDMDRVLSGWKPLIRLGANMPARAERIGRKSDFDQYGPRSIIPSRNGEVHEVVLYFGIIDILQDYDISKKLEHAYKSLQVDPVSISAVDPRLYSKRFRDFIGRIFVQEG